MIRFFRWMMMSVLIVVGLTHIVAAQTLVVGITDWRPYNWMTDEMQATGIVVDILHEVSKRTGYTFTYNQWPQKRFLLYFREGQFTVEPACNPAWREVDQDISRYTVAYMQAKNVVLMKKGSGIKATSPKDFQGKVFGCDLGYSYADGFEDAFKHGEITRDDAPTGTKGNIQKLAADRVDGIIIDPVVGRYWIEELQMNQDDFEEVYTFKDDNSLFMRIHVSQEALLPALNTALEAMKAEGIIETIVGNYTK